MSINFILNRQIKDYLLENPVDRNSENPYGDAAKHFDVDKEKIRQVWKALRKKGLVEKDKTQETKSPETFAYEIAGSGDSLNLQAESDIEVKNEKDLIDLCSIDTEEWSILEWKCKRYTGWVKNKDGSTESRPLYAVSARLKKRLLDNDLNKQKVELLGEIKEYIETVTEPIAVPDYKGEGLLLELALFDVHLGKLSWKEESGEDYDLKIACERYRSGVDNLLSKVPRESIERILLPIGNDMIHIDNRQGTTTAGTYVASDSRFRKILLVARSLLVETIDKLLQIAPVDIVVVSGNHDYDTMFTLGMIVESFYYNNSNVTIDNTAKQRKYYKFGSTGILFSHGNEEKHGDLGLIFATEQPKLWADCKFREVQLGHYHKNKKLSYLSVDDQTGFQVQILPSLSGTDWWHNSKGYNSLKQAKAFLFDKEEGKIAEFTHTIR